MVAFERRHATQTNTEKAPVTFGLVVSKAHPGIGHRHLRGGQGEVHEAVHPLHVFLVDIIQRLEILVDLTGNPARKRVGIEHSNHPDTVVSAQRRLPGGGDVQAKGGHGTETGDDHAPRGLAVLIAERHVDGRPHVSFRQ